MFHSKNNDCTDFDGFTLFSFDEESESEIVEKANDHARDGRIVREEDDVLLDEHMQDVDDSWIFDEQLALFDDSLRTASPTSKWAAPRYNIVSSCRW